MTNSTIDPRVLELLRFTETHHSHHEELMRATGGNFNLFQVLGIGHYEVKTHSPILAELLNPKGRHGQGELFLKLFLDQIGIGKADFEAKDAKVTTEYYVGEKTDDSGGRIDIIIKDGSGRKILIENKIHAPDQEKQMTRYRNFDDKAHLFYLTLQGNYPSNLSPAETEKIGCILISYAEHVLKWLITCRKEAACIPGVREIISQYITLIEELTHKSTTMETNKKLIEEITGSRGALQAFYTLREADSAVQTELISRLDTQLHVMAKAIGLKKEGVLEELDRKDSVFSFSNPGLIRCNLHIGFSFEKGGYNNFCFGFKKTDPDRDCPANGDLPLDFKAKFQSEPPSDWWPAWSYFEDPYRHWRHDAFEGIRSGQLAENLKVKIESMSQIAEKVCG